MKNEHAKYNLGESHCTTESEEARHKIPHLI